MKKQEANSELIGQLSGVYENSEAENISDWVLEHITGKKRTDRIINKEDTLTPQQVLQLKQYLDRLLQHEPVQYVLNEAWFCGLKFYVDKNVLIPRPETEELVEWVISDCKFPIHTLSILDIGSGSGCIPIALKKRLGKADVWSCDISPDALKVANQNAETLGIVPDNDALIFYKAIAAFGKNHLTRNGAIYTEINENLGEETAAMFQLKGYKTVIKKDMQGKDRMIKAFTN